MAQPPEYHRTKDFTVDLVNETDHTALNSEFDDAANAINDIRANLAILQADDGKLRPNVITMDSISTAVYDGIISKMAGQDISQAVLSQAESFSIEAAKLAAECAVMLETLKQWQSTLLDEIFPIDHLFISFKKKAPNVGVWELIDEGVVLLSAGDTYQAGEIYGANSIKLSVDQLPAHNHGITINNNGGHTHNRGSMNIWAEWRSSTYDYATGGAVYQADNSGTGGGRPNKSGATGRYILDAARNWTGETSNNGSHNHSASIANTGSGKDVSIMQKSIAVYIFRRIS